MKLNKPKLKLLGFVLGIILVCPSCGSYQNPGNNTGKTGDGTKANGRTPESDSANKALYEGSASNNVKGTNPKKEQ